LRTRDRALDHGIRYFEVPPVRIEQATDLGNVQVLKHANLYLLTDQFGDIHPDSRGLGMYVGDTRRLSCSILRLGRERPVLLQVSSGTNYRGTIQLTNPRLERNYADKVFPLDEIEQRKLGITRDRLLCSDALEERVHVVNFAEHGETVELDLQLAADAADIFEVRGWERPARGTYPPIAIADDGVTFRYDGLDGIRRLTHVRFGHPPERITPIEDSGSTGWVRAEWRLELPKGGTREISWTVWTSERPLPPEEVSGDGRSAVVEDPGMVFPPAPRVTADEAVASYRAWLQSFCRVRTDNELFNLTIDRSASDLRLLLNDGPGSLERYLAAGVPWFATLFGRDALITALQCLAFQPRLAVETLDVLAARQATTLDPERDAEPGKILHELRAGEMALNGETPHTPYYGSVDSTPLWLVLLAATVDWTGDLGLAQRLWPNALAALAWIDEHADLDGDGFVEYLRRSDLGLVNQGWKDSHDAIRDRHGSIVAAPIALAEVQGYVFMAKRGIAALALQLGEVELADRLETEAETLRQRFEDAFWLPDQAYYAMALGGGGRVADALGSNAGQCLWTGIVAPHRARLVAQRLLAPQLFSGWGVRTYAADQPGYNPIGYHVGTVWPHDNSLIAAGLKRYGLHDEANGVVGRVFEAAQHFPGHRLPELFCGFDREASPVPVPYPVACSPQAWAAGATFLFLETMLGLRAHATRGELELRRPHLPEWLTKVTVENLRVGDATVDLLFHRWRGTTSAEVLRKTGTLDVTIRI